MTTQIKTKQTISEITRRDITDSLITDRVNWSGRLDEPGFLGRVWKLSEMASYDGRFRDAAGDIWQHRINNYDWDDDWVFHDDRFDLAGCPDEVFVRFLAEMLHPVVRADLDEVKHLLAFFNECLANDDWELIEVRQLSGRPIFEGRRREALKTPIEALDLGRYRRLDDPQVIRDHLRRIDRDVKSDPAGAIGSSKELVETVLKQILDEYEIDYKKGDDVMDLYKKVQKELRLNAEAVPGDRKGSKAAVKTLRALETTIQSLAELRNEIGTGHGRTGRSPALTRHARLAFNAAVTVVEFLLDTWHVRRQDEHT